MDFKLMISCLLLLVSLKVNTAATSETESSKLGADQLSTIARLGTEFNNASNDVQRLMISVQILGIDCNTNNPEITKAYRRLSVKLHPDKNIEHKESAEQAFKGLGLAYSFMERFKSQNKSTQESIVLQADTARQTVGKRVREEEDDDEEVRRMRIARRARKWGRPAASSSSSGPIALDEQAIEDVMRKAFERNKRFHLDDKEEAVEYFTYKGFDKVSVEAHLPKIFAQFQKWVWIKLHRLTQPWAENMHMGFSMRDFHGTSLIDTFVSRMRDVENDQGFYAYLNLCDTPLISLEGIEDIPGIEKVRRIEVESSKEIPLKIAIDHLTKLEALKWIEIRGDPILLNPKEEFEARGITIY